MIVTEIPLELDLDAAANVPLIIQAPRGVGLHASEIYGSLYQGLEPDRFRPGSKPHTVITAIGLAWEQWLERTLIGMGELVCRPGELVSPEQVLYNPDLFVANGEDRVGEIKSTCMSSKLGIEGPKCDKYHCQAKIYCFWSGTRHARFYVLFLRGDYKFMKKGAKHDDDGFPELHCYDVTYTDRELHDNYLMLMNHAIHKDMFARHGLCNPTLQEIQTYGKSSR